MNLWALSFILFGLTFFTVARPIAARMMENNNRGRRPSFRSPYGRNWLRTVTWSNRLCGVFSVAFGITVWTDPDFLKR